MSAPRPWLRRLVPAAALLLACLVAVPAHAATVTVASGGQFRDTAGNVVHAHGGGVLKVGQYYYWFGENRNTDNTFRNVSVYRSTDLRTWEFRNNVLTQASHAELASANIERPKVVYNSSTGQFVMWMHKEGATNYAEARAAVATSSTVDGAYTYRGSFRPLGYMSRDITLFRDDDGTAYMISAANENADLHVYRLTADYLGVSAQVQRLWPGSYREAPAMFKRNGVYFLLTSGATGWAPNQQKYATATSVTGTWSGLQNTGDNTAYGSQTAYVLPVQGSTTTSYLYLGDRWAGAWGGRVNDSQYIWLPLQFPTATSLSLGWAPQVSIDTATGVVQGTAGPAEQLVARHSGKCLDVSSGSTADSARTLQYTCGSGTNQRFTVQDLGTGYVRLVARHSGKCLDVTSGSTADGATVVQYTCGGGTNQQWQVQDAGGGYVRFVARHSGKCLDVSGASTADGTAVIQWTCGGGTNQQWTRRVAA
ncbi:RICIN domain-containing protein [Dactylosporangium aurantiacum]|uniref:RICIN domain-containing protein n=1 Tax=Dactylosporangium aurantiacum TaxID=35754 RepID=A0A9Q9MK99_9ACTN|nr:RICIN domain-containing protein [Dactylosporangium aurantiacum]MDG6103258.1 RICIN domain-containing protein [Dactylosporangium aurantiacum]UWZ57760.1 RICIN domain-containing protein [Dactylosporangium aurantiacum]